MDESQIPIDKRMKHRIMKYLPLALLLLLSLTAQAQESLTTQAALESIGRNNLQLQALEQEHGAQVLEAKAENTLSGPSVEYSPFYQKGYHGMAESELIVSEEFDFPTKYAARNKQANLRRQALDQQYLQARRDILLQAQTLCFDLIRLNQTLRMHRQRLNDSEDMLRLFQKRMDAGDGNLLELNKVKIDRMDVQKLVSNAESERLDLVQQLQELNGGQPIDVTDTRFPDQPLDIDCEAFVRQTLSTHADVLAAEADLKATSHEVGMAQREWLPNVKLGYRRNTEQRESLNGFMVGVAFPMFSSQSRVRAAKMRQNSSQLQLEQARQSAESTLRSRYQQLVSLRRVLDHDDVEMMTETLALLNKALQHGEISALQYYTEISSIYEKLQTHIDTHCQAAKLYAELHANEL